MTKDTIMLSFPECLETIQNWRRHGTTWKDISLLRRKTILQASKVIAERKRDDYWNAILTYPIWLEIVAILQREEEERIKRGRIQL